MFFSCPEIPLEAREIIGEGKNRFLQLLEMHPWVFAVFPSRVFVALRRKLVDIEYGEIWEEGGLYDLIEPDGYNYTLESAVSSRGTSPSLNAPSVASSQSSVGTGYNNQIANGFMFGQPNSTTPATSVLNPMLNGQSTPSFMGPPPFPPFGQPLRPPGGVPPPPYAYFRHPAPMPNGAGIFPVLKGLLLNQRKFN